MRAPPEERPAGPALVGLLAVFLAGFVGIYVAALGAGPGARVDENALKSQAAWQLGVPDQLGNLLATISISSLMLVALGGVALALWRRRTDIAIAIVVLLVGANLSTQLLKDLLVTAEPFVQSDRPIPGAFPSGHATAAASVALVVVMAVGPALRRWAVTLAVLYAVGVGIATVALGWHYPSDVLGAYMVAGAWAAGVGAVIGLLSGGPWVASLHGFKAPMLVAMAVVVSAAVAVWAGGSTRGPLITRGA